MTNASDTTQWTDTLTYQARTSKSSASNLETSTERLAGTSIDKKEETPIQTVTVPRHCGSLDEMEGLDTLSNLESSDIIILLSPAISPAANSRSVPIRETMDPFEKLGRALSKYEKTVRHVPYIPSVGFTETHETLLKYVDGVVAIICEPATGADAQKAQESLKKQIRFVDDAQESWNSDGFVVVTCSGNENRPTESDLTKFDNVIQFPYYNSYIADFIADKILKHD